MCTAAFLSRRLLPLILMDTYVGVSCFVLQVLLNQMAAVVLCSLRFRVLNLKISCACLAFANLFVACHELDYRVDVCRITKGAHIELLLGM